jgi:phage shock protein C
VLFLAVLHWTMSHCYRGWMERSMVRPRNGKVIAGVCAALADRFGVSRTLVRIGFVLFGLFGVGELVYIALWIIIPKAQ